MLVKNDFTKKEIMYSGAFYSASIIINRFAAAINTFIIVYFLTVYEYGVFKLILSLVGMFQSFMISGLDGVVRNDIAIELKNKRQDRAAQIFFEFFFFKIVLALIIWSALYFFIIFFAGDRYDLTFISILKIASLTIILNCFSDTFSLYFKGIGALSMVSKINSGLEILRLVIIVSFFEIFGANILILMWSIIVTQLISQLFYFIAGYEILIGWWGQFHWKLSSDIFKIIKTYGKWSVLSNIFSSLKSNVRNYIIKFLISTEAVAIFNVALSMVSSLYQILPSDKILSVFLPYKISKEDIKAKYFIMGVKYATFLYLSLIIIGSIFGTIIVKLFFVKYGSSLPIFYIMLTSFVGFGLFDFVSGYLYAMKYQKELFIRSFIKNILVVGLPFIFVPLFGIYGLGVEYVVTSTIWTISLYLLLRKLYPELTLQWKNFKVNKDEIGYIIYQTKSVIRNIFKS